MVPAELLREAVDKLNKWNPHKITAAGWVNWRKGFQVKMNWYGNASFSCYLDFGKNVTARDAVLAKVFERYALVGEKPRVIEGHGWSSLDCTLYSKTFISVNDVADIASSMGFEFSILYVQDCVSSRPIFGDMGIPLVPGEMGKEWVNGSFQSYSCPSGQNL